MRFLLKVELDYENKSSFLPFFPLIYPIFHFIILEEESRLNNVYFYNDNKVIQKAE